MNHARRYREVCERIEQAAERRGVDPQGITLVAVSKQRPIDALRALYDLGHRVFGESRLQEALPKIEALPTDIEWHFVGALQSNKAHKAAQRFSVIHSLSTPAQMRKIERAAVSVDVLIQVNLAEEPQKMGIPAKLLDETVKLVLNYPHIRLRGLMTIGPNLGDAESMRPYYRALREAGERVGLPWLSMGMSGDFDVAIQEGATHVRIGTLLFGARSEN